MKSGLAVAGVAVAAVFVVVPPGARANPDGDMAFADQESPIPSADNKKLVAHLKSHGKSPEEYVVSKFSDHDISLPKLISRKRSRTFLISTAGNSSRSLRTSSKACAKKLISRSVFVI
jgi:hypothetical protein